VATTNAAVDTAKVLHDTVKTIITPGNDVFQN
jgi:hypothetical protein